MALAAPASTVAVLSTSATALQRSERTMVPPPPTASPRPAHANAANVAQSSTDVGRWADRRGGACATPLRALSLTAAWPPLRYASLEKGLPANSLPKC